MYHSAMEGEEHGESGKRVVRMEIKILSHLSRKEMKVFQDQEKY